jgi:PEP-CTERM motif
MKKLLLTVSLLVAAVTAFGQGQVIFANNTATKVTNSVSQTAAPAGTMVGLYIGNSGAAEGSLSLITSTNMFAAGLFQGGTRTLSGWAGGPVTLQVRAWSAGYNSYEEARLSGLNTTFTGASSLMNVTLTTSPTPAPLLTSSGLNQFNISPVPEPSSIALGLLGLGAVALFRRRK